MKIVDSLKKCFPLLHPEGLTRKEHDKRLFLSFCILLMIPAILIFGIIDLFTGRLLEAGLVFGVITMLVALVVLLGRNRRFNLILRLIVTFLNLILFYELYIGGGGGSAFLWFFLLPSSTIFLLGFKEGVIWMSAMIVIMSVMLFGKIGHEYSFDLASRFVAIFSTISILAAILENLRDRYLRQLIEDKDKLQKALDEIRVLKGMVPICASCKRIRDDKGFWTRIEAYMKKHSDVEFSHGICPECAQKMYPSKLWNNDTVSEKNSAYPTEKETADGPLPS
jgi:hypothetical protein